jgi:hypothetical protein
MFKALFLTIVLLLYQYRKLILGLLIVSIIIWLIVAKGIFKIN